MHLFATFRRLHAPLVCLAIACVVSVGCRTKQEVIALGQPTEAYRADDGSVLFGYFVQPTIKPDYTGWHWLVIEPDTASLLLRGLPTDASEQSQRVVTVDYTGWGRNARLIPPLVEPGLPDDTPPVLGDGGLTELRFVWDDELRGVRLLDADWAGLPLMRVSPDFATLRIREYRTEVMLDVLKVVGIAALVAGLILLGGEVAIDTN